MVLKQCTTIHDTPDQACRLYVIVPCLRTSPYFGTRTFFTAAELMHSYVKYVTREFWPHYMPVRCAHPSLWAHVAVLLYQAFNNKSVTTKLYLLHSRKRGKYIIIMKVNNKCIFPGSFHTDLLPLHRRHCCGQVYRHLPARLQKPLHEVHLSLKWMVS